LRGTGAAPFESCRVPVSAPGSEVTKRQDQAKDPSDEQAERVSGRVRQHVERLALLGGAVQQDLRAELLGPRTMPFELLTGRHPEVEMQLHRYVVARPRGALQAVDLLDRQHPATV